MKEKNRGITLIALVITIIVLLILAGISIATLTGENGILTKASEAGRQTDIKDTKEQIKIELMGNYDEQNIDYTNEDVIEAIQKVTEREVAENTAIIKTRKGNDVDISDLWIQSKKYWFKINDIDCYFTEEELYDGVTDVACCNAVEWIDLHVDGVRIEHFMGGAQPLFCEVEGIDKLFGVEELFGGFQSLDYEEYIIRDGSELSCDEVVTSLSSRIHYDKE